MSPYLRCEGRGGREASARRWRTVLWLVGLLIPVLLPLSWISTATARLDAVRPAATTAVAVAHSPDAGACSLDLERIVRRDLRSCGLVIRDGARVCPPALEDVAATNPPASTGAPGLPGATARASPSPW